MAFLSAAMMLLLTWRTGMEITDSAKETARIVASTFERAFNFTPEITVDSVVVIAANTPVLEVTTVARQARVRETWSQTWLHSTKTIEIEATFTARAGYDLRDTFQIQIDPRTGNLGATLPAPRILDIGMSEVRVLRDEDGLWNKLTNEDRSQAYAALEKRARAQFEKTNLVAAAQQEGEKRVRELLDAAGRRAQFATPTPRP